ncbi:hypothetical protein JJD82_27895 [Pseudomonas sp. MF6747]|uniref:hypothetical protein n=1 Tax=Pseudomonas sp. MF6747 TaxID=2797527 RepID=UPI00190BBAF5|nr:hypothetical protein [Pseudomonas sp. MF6747]MBK3510818.1 hypothetical protein [Pseudomonas sp. MF6747]
MLKVANAFAQCVFHATLVAEILEQRVVVDDLLRSAKVTLGPLCIGAQTVVVGLIA